MRSGGIAIFVVQIILIFVRKPGSRGVDQYAEEQRDGAESRAGHFTAGP